MTEHRIGNVRWADPGLQTKVEISCSCGKWAKTYSPKQEPGQPLPGDLAKQEFRAHKREEEARANAGGSPGDGAGS